MCFHLSLHTTLRTFIHQVSQINTQVSLFCQIMPDWSSSRCLSVIFHIHSTVTLTGLQVFLFFFPFGNFVIRKPSGLSRFRCQSKNRSNFIRTDDMSDSMNFWIDFGRLSARKCYTCIHWNLIRKKIWESAKRETVLWILWLNITVYYIYTHVDRNKKIV